MTTPDPTPSAEEMAAVAAIDRLTLEVTEPATREKAYKLVALTIARYTRHEGRTAREWAAKLREVEAERDGLADIVDLMQPNSVVDWGATAEWHNRPDLARAIARARALQEVAEAADSLEQHELADVPRNLLTPYQARLTSALDAWRANSQIGRRTPIC